MPNIWEEAKNINEEILNENEMVKRAEENFKAYAKTIPHITVLPKESYYPEDDGLYDDLWESPLS